MRVRRAGRLPPVLNTRAIAAAATGVSGPPETSPTAAPSPRYALAYAPPVHTGPVVSAEFSRDGRLLATASRDRTVRLWHPATGLPVGEPLDGHTDQVWSVAFSPDGGLLATAGHDNTVRVHGHGGPRTPAPSTVASSALRAVEHVLSQGHHVPLPALRRQQASHFLAPVVSDMKGPHADHWSQGKNVGFRGWVADWLCQRPGVRVSSRSPVPRAPRRASCADRASTVLPGARGIRTT
ncbi:WD40 repeat domain-containing protein [Streptomyces sp. NPDC094468]|uniref:WD40 repeat domain-containing protein n=1 Tax=Streptomyces sp. NPDC094468 TaxID=3366066 RepID=UPI00382F34A5